MRIFANSGFYSFYGESAESESFINSQSYTNNPYGSKSALSYGLSFDARYVNKANWLFGANTGYERLRSKINLKFDDVIMGDIMASFKGKTILNNSFINLFPYFGKRFFISKQNIDLTGGFDFAFLLSSREKGSATTTSAPSDYHIKTSVDRKNISFDFRPRIQIATDFNHVGIYAGYSYGLMNYLNGYVGGKFETYSRMWRIGLSYKI